MNEEYIISNLKGNTLRVYWYLIRSSESSVGPRKIQRKLGFSSPALGFTISINWSGWAWSKRLQASIIWSRLLMWTF